MRITTAFILILLFVSCSGGDDKGELLAKVGDAELYQSDLAHYFAKDDFSIDDSIALLNELRDNWINDQILVNEAASSEGVEMDEIERKVNQYKNDLLIHDLLKTKVYENLDTVITDGEIQTYYNQHIDEFQLNDYLVKVLYLKVSEDAPDIDKITSAYKLRKPEHIEEIEIFAKIYASNFYYDMENWIYFDDLLKEVPLHDINKDKFIINKSKIRFQENGYYYFLNVMDYKLKNTASPLSFEKDKIKERILSMRTKKLEQSLKEEMINNAYNNDEIEIYN
ncbi:MAG: hypothetical protein MK078_13090 [Crocinitomicaceae bacterium]|nr:hypothetical protein [Crocinitomicaceae bacterium]